MSSQETQPTENEKNTDKAARNDVIDTPSTTASPQIPSEEIPQKVVLGQSIDLQSYEKGRLFAEFPFSPETYLALQEKGFSVATRSQTAVIERLLARKSILAPLGYGGSRFLPICLALVEFVGMSVEKPRAMVFCSEEDKIGYISQELSEVGKYRNLSILQVYTKDDIEAQKEALNGDVDIIIGEKARLTELILQDEIDLSTFDMVAFDNVQPTDFASDTNIAMFQKLQSISQIFGFYSGIGPQHVASLGSSIPSLEVVSFDLGKESMANGCCIVEASAKSQAIYALLQQSVRPVAIFCSSSQEQVALWNELTTQGVAAEMLFADHAKRQKEKIFRSIRQNRVSCLLFTTAHIERSAFDSLIVTSVLQNEALFKVFQNKASWILTQEEYDGSPERFAHMQKLPPPTAVGIAQVDFQRLVAGLRRQGFLHKTEKYRSILALLDKEPDREQLLMTALHGFVAWDRLENIDVIDNFRKLEGKETRSSPRRHRSNRRNYFKRK